MGVARPELGWSGSQEAERCWPRLYLITDRQRTGGRALVDVVEQALQGGVDTVQLREKDLPARALVELAQALLRSCRARGARLLINDRVDVALAIGAHGVHLPASSFAVGDARRLLGPNACLGVSTHNLAEARAAATGGADFVVFGPLFDTPSKRAFGAPLGLASLQTVTASVSAPVLAIGGIDAEGARQARLAGAQGVAVIGAILEAADPAAASAQLRAALSE